MSTSDKNKSKSKPISSVQKIPSLKRISIDEVFKQMIKNNFIDLRYRIGKEVHFLPKLPLNSEPYHHLLVRLGIAKKHIIQKGLTNLINRIVSESTLKKRRETILTFREEASIIFAKDFRQDEADMLVFNYISQMKYGKENKVQKTLY
jgi:hypothetical protein